MQYCTNHDHKSQHEENIINWSSGEIKWHIKVRF